MRQGSESGPRSAGWLGGLLFVTASALAADLPPAERNLELRDAVQQAVRDNAALRSLRARWEAMRERPAQSGALPNPMLTVGGMDAARGGDWPDTSEKRAMVEQDFPGFGKRALREGIAARDAEAMRYELDAMTRDVVMKVKETYFELYGTQRALAIAGEEEEILRRMAKVAETMYATGERTQADVLTAQAEISMLKQKLLELRAREGTLKARLNTLLDQPVDQPLGAAVLPPDAGAVGPEAAGAGAVTNRPEVLAAQAQVERSDLERRLMQREGLPDYRLGVEYRDLADEDNMLMFTFSVDLPVWRSKIRSGVREAERMRAASLAAREAAERQAALEAQEARLGLAAAQRTLELYSTELVPQAEARFIASEAGYRAGKVDFMDLLESERFLLGARTMVAMTEGEVGMQAARLERAAGHQPSGISH